MPNAFVHLAIGIAIVAAFTWWLILSSGGGDDDAE